MVRRRWAESSDPGYEHATFVRAGWLWPYSDSPRAVSLNRPTLHLLSQAIRRRPKREYPFISPTFVRFADMLRSKIMSCSEGYKGLRSPR